MSPVKNVSSKYLESLRDTVKEPSVQMSRN